MGEGFSLCPLVRAFSLDLAPSENLYPVLCFLGTALNNQYFDPRIEKHAVELTKVRELAWAEFETETPQISQPPSQFGDPLSILPDFFREIGRKVAGYSQWMKMRAEALSEALAYLRDNFTEIMESMTALFVLVLEKIILLAILLPIGLLYCLRKAYRWLAEEELDQWIRTLFDHSSEEAEEIKS